MLAFHPAVTWLARVGMLLVAPHVVAGELRAGVPETPAPLPLLAPATVEYRWTFRTPEWVIEPRRLETDVVAPTWRPARIEFAWPDVKTERRRIARVAEFSCKYPDLRLPNECRTTWHDVSIDVPVVVMRNDYVEIDVPHLSWQHWQTNVDVPRLTWKEETLVVSLPALAVPAAP